VEGIFDVLNLYDKGLRNALCIFGVNSLTVEKLNLLKIMGVSGIDLLYDPDAAGREAAEKDEILIEDNGFRVRNINLKNTDPGDMTSNNITKLKEKLYP
jgi:DNA primase